MFTNRGFTLKLGAALAAVALMGVYAERRGRSMNPALWRCLAEPARWEGTELRVSGQVASSDATGFVLDTGRGRIRVDRAADVRPGAPLTVRGKFRREGPTLEFHSLRRARSEGLFRWIIEAVSLLVMGLIVLNFLRHFSARPAVLRVERGD